MFKKAVKHDAKLRLAICGPAGAGKTYSLLSIATALGGPIAVVDTEHGSASKYADIFEFDVIEPSQFDPRELVKTIAAAADGGYKTIIIDSLSHYWMGKGGELDLVDATAKRSTQGNSFAAWKTVTPFHNALIDTIISAPIHVLVSMRTKTEWVVEKDERGKSVPRKVGLAPVMRDGIEFEFDVCGDIDQDNNLTITKSRCPALANQVVNRPGAEMAKVLQAWLVGAGPAPAQPAPPPQQSGPQADWRDGFAANVSKAKATLGEEAIGDLLEAAGVKSLSDFNQVSAREWWSRFVQPALRRAAEQQQQQQQQKEDAA